MLLCNGLVPKPRPQNRLARVELRVKRGWWHSEFNRFRHPGTKGLGFRVWGLGFRV